MKRTTKMILWTGGLVAGVLAVGGVAYAATHKPAMTGPGNNIPIIPTVSPQTSTTWDKGKPYVFAATVPTGTHDADSLIQALAANGWKDVQVVYFGPTGSMVANVKLPFSVDTNMYAATGTWDGADKSAIPAGVTSVG